MSHQAEILLDRMQKLRECQTAYRYLAKKKYHTLNKNCMWRVMGNLTDEISEIRNRIAIDSAPWFDGSAFK